MAIFLSAFLLFQVQLIVGKQLLPWFGGAPAVWSTCLVFFQVLLLAGYAYAHLLITCLRSKVGVYVHLFLLLLAAGSLAAFACVRVSPIFPSIAWRPADPSAPALHILVLLSISVGLPFFLLSTTGPLVQAWFAGINPHRSPYKLYAISNIGSLLGLITYPLLWEPVFTLRNQGRIWTLGFFGFVWSCSVCALRMLRTHNPQLSGSGAQVTPRDAGPRPSRGQYLLWFGLAACGCIMLLAVTNLMCQEIAAIPFLWVIPLSVYLVTFILCFSQKRLYWRAVFHPLFVAGVVWSIVVFLQAQVLRLNLWSQLTGFTLLLFVACMVYHGELAALKPRASHLTFYYLVIALGGATGSVFVGLIAPHLFPAFWEFQLGLWASGLLVAVVLLRERNSWLQAHPRWLPILAILILAGIADYFAGWLRVLHPARSYLHVASACLAILVLSSAWRWRLAPARRPQVLQAAVLCGWCAFGLLFWYGAHEYRSHSVYLSRSLYGVLRVYHFYPIRLTDTNLADTRFHQLVLAHGVTTHGAQFQDPAKQDEPTTYFTPQSGIGLLLTNLLQRQNPDPAGRRVRLGIIGLGAGTLAAYGQPGDYIRFYEINPDVVRVTRGKNAFFTYVNHSPAQIDVVLGDARISLERELASRNPQNFDVLVIDAFNSDSIPLHLLTREAMAIYLRHLRGPRSVIAIHISNAALDLGPVLAGLAREYKLNLLHIALDDPAVDMGSPSNWILLAADDANLNVPDLLWRSTPVDSPEPPPLWTDDYSNLLQVLK